MRILKVGGSLLARKGEAPRFETAAFVRILREIADSGAVPEALIHGAGAYGHNVADEAKDKNDLLPAHVSRIRASVAQLRAHVAASMVGAGFTHYPLSPQEMFSMDERGHPLTPIARDVLSKGSGIMTWGDVAFENGRHRIYSGDEAALDLASSISGPHELFFATDVDGILHPDTGGVIAEFTPPMMDIFRGAARDGQRPDVTGGMAGKAARAISMARLGHTVTIFNGNKPGAVIAALRGESPGTRVTVGDGR